MITLSPLCRASARRSHPKSEHKSAARFFAAALAASLCLLTGCAVNRPVLTERVIATNGVITERTLTMTSFVIWPATSSLDKQRASIGKTMSAGTSGLMEEGGGTNVVEALRELNSMVGKVVK
jgi:hypothetical protein